MKQDEQLRLFENIARYQARTTETLDKVAKNLEQMNDKNILHHTEIQTSLKILNSWVFKLIIILVLALAVLAGVDKISPLVSSFF